MRYDFQCPWCGAETSLRSSTATWRMQLPCDLCDREMIVTFGGNGVVSRCADGPLVRGEETVRIRNAR